MATMQSDFVRERNEALFSLDEEKILSYYRRHRMPWDEHEDEIVFWASVYKAICHIVDAPDELVKMAKEWLYAHDMGEKLTTIT